MFPLAVSRLAGRVRLAVLTPAVSCLRAIALDADMDGQCSLNVKQTNYCSMRFSNHDCGFLIEQ